MGLYFFQGEVSGSRRESALTALPELLLEARWEIKGKIEGKGAREHFMHAGGHVVYTHVHVWEGGSFQEGGATGELHFLQRLFLLHLWHPDPAPPSPPPPTAATTSSSSVTPLMRSEDEGRGEACRD